MINILMLASLWCATITETSVPLKTVKSCRKAVIECLQSAETDDKKLQCAKSANNYE